MMTPFIRTLSLVAGLFMGSALWAQLSLRSDVSYFLTGVSSDGTTAGIEMTVTVPYSATPPPATASYLEIGSLAIRKHLGVTDTIDWQFMLAPSATSWTAIGTGTGAAFTPTHWAMTYKASSTTEEGLAFAAAHINGEATYECFVIKGSPEPISDYQDYGRKMDFDNPHMWELDAAASTGTLKAMAGWRLVNATVGINSNGAVGAQLYNGEYGDGSGAAQIVSPSYPDGISNLVFTAFATMTTAPAHLSIHTSPDGTTWTPVELNETNVTATAAPAFESGAIVLSASPTVYTVALNLPAGSRYRIIRSNYQNVSADKSMTTVVVKTLRVRSAAPAATLGPMVVTVDGKPATEQASAQNPFTLSFEAKASTSTRVPTDYSAVLKVTRRGDDLSKPVFSQKMKLASSSGSLSTATLTASFVKSGDWNDETYIQDGAFLTEGGNPAKLVGLLPNVYDVTVDFGVQGSFLAGRERVGDDLHINDRETTTFTLTGANNDEMVVSPYILNVRENATARKTVVLKVSMLDETSSQKKMTIVDFPCEPVPVVQVVTTEDGRKQQNELAPNKWRVLLPKTLPDTTEFEALSYAWGNNKIVDDQAVLDGVADDAVLSVKVAVTTSTAPQQEVYYGQTVTTSTTKPQVLSVSPAITEKLNTHSTGNENQVSPFVLNLATLKQSDLFVEIDFSLAEPTIRFSGAVQQDFNTWNSMSNVFSEMKYSADMTFARTRFDVVTDWVAGSTTEKEIKSGWKPDEGPYAGMNALSDAFLVGREGADKGEGLGKPVLYFKDEAELINEGLAPWGAASEPAYLRYMQRDNVTSTLTQGMKLSAGAELVLSRTTTFNSDNNWQADGMIRLRHNGIQGAYAEPIEDSANIDLKGVGTVSFSMRMALPYDIGQRLAFVLDKSISPRGIQASISGGTPVSMVSGYSVSYYLQDLSTRTIYELRLTETLNFHVTAEGPENKQQPVTQTLVEMYRWTSAGGRYTASRIALNGGDFHRWQHPLMGRTYAFWVDNNGYLRAGEAAANGTVTTTNNVLSASAVITGSPRFKVGVNSAECAPTFARLQYTTTTTPSWVALSPTTTYEDLDYPGSGWRLGTDEQNALYVSRESPSANLSGVLRILTLDGNDNILREETEEATLFAQSKVVTKEMGQTNATLRLIPAEGSNLFIDNISVSSWCGNDENRNGPISVPQYTDKGLKPNDADLGFAAVGVWVTPKDPAELNVSKEAYSGDQVLLMQYSRRNTACGVENTNENGVTITADTLALYLPYTAKSYGSVNLRYSIPGSISANVMLQYAETTSPHTDFLTTPGAGLRWFDASDVVELIPTGGGWQSMTILPTLLPDDFKNGYLRLVMVSPAAGTKADPLFYLDEVTVTDKSDDLGGSWSATNAMIYSTPADDLYWKDRLPAQKQTRTTPFAEKTQLTPALILNDETTVTQTEAGTLPVEYPIAALMLPALGEEGAGRVTFSARLLEEQDTPVRIYLMATEDGNSESPAYKAVDYIEVTSTVWQSYSFNCVSLDRYLNSTTPDFSYGAIKRLRLEVPLRDGEKVGEDGDTSFAGKVLLDRVIMAKPVVYTAEVDAVDFLNSKTTDTFRGRTSPLSQIVADAPEMAVRVQLKPYDVTHIDEDSIRVFFSYKVTKPSSTGEITPLVKSVSGSYTDVLGSSFSASPDAPIYLWNNPSEWGSWFTLPDASEVSADKTAALPLRGDGTVELTKTTTGYVADISGILAGVPANSLVRFMAWTYSVDKEGAIPATSAMKSVDYLDFPWYFPRNLNAEINATRKATDPKAEEVFSPYFWVYSSIPGEVFINEFNIRDGGKVPSDATGRSFVEVCAPVGADLTGWTVATTDGHTLGIYGMASVPEATAPATNELQAPAAGVVPALRVSGSSSERTFVTFFTDSTKYYTTASGAEAGAQEGNVVNAGLGVSNVRLLPRYDDYTNANSLRLYRPTGGADHILVFTNGDQEQNIATLTENVDALASDYREAYETNGFACDTLTEESFSPWAQTFISGDWKDKLPAGDAELTEATATGARLVALKLKPGAAADSTNIADYLFDFASDQAEGEYTSTQSAYINSFSTLDMGTTWVQTDNKVSAKTTSGPTDLTHLFTAGALGFDPLAQARLSGTDVMVTPRQVNPRQYILKYEGLSQIGVKSNIAGRGSHKLMVGGTPRYGGFKEEMTWSVPESYPEITLTYTPAAYYTLATVSVAFENKKTGEIVTDLAVVKSLFTTGVTTQNVNADALTTIDTTTGVVDLTNALTIDTTTGVADITMNVVQGEVIYNPTFTATFVVDDTRGGGITSVSTYCGENGIGISGIQPWWGSGFGFQAVFDDSDDMRAAKGILVVFPYDKASLGTNLNLVASGVDLDAALETITNAATAATPTIRYARIDGLTGNTVRLASAVEALGNIYGKDEPAIPYVVWGIYTDTAPNANGDDDTMTYVLRQKLDPATFTALWYRGQGYAPGIAAGQPYFHLYSTPPHSMFVNEVELTTDPFVEVAVPTLREALLLDEDGNPSDALKTDYTQWKIGIYYYDNANTLASVTPVALTAPTNDTLRPYTYSIVDGLTLPPEAYTTYAVVLERPNGIVENGVWTGTAPAGGAATAPAGASEWLTFETTKFTYVANGVMDNSADNSAQLVGALAEQLDGRQLLTNDPALRKDWKLAETTEGAINTDVPGYETPEWSQVRFTSTMVNAVAGFAHDICGYWLDAPLIDANTGNPSTTPYSALKSDTDWVFRDTNPFAFSYRLRSGYCFQSVALPKDLLGKAMLFGSTTPFADVDTLQTAVNDMQRDTTLTPQAWLNMDGLANVTEVGGQVVVTFNPDQLMTEEETFKDITEFYLTLVIVETPLLSVNDIVVTMTKGTLVPGQWLASQTFFAWDGATPNVEKGGLAVGKINAEYPGGFEVTPIWSDEEGLTLFSKETIEGVETIVSETKYSDVHGWVYQPVVGDNLGMTVTLLPESGLTAYRNVTPEALRAALSQPTTTARIRPFLVWSLIPAEQVDYGANNSDFFQHWGLDRWLDRDPTALTLNTLRKRMADATAVYSPVFYSNAGIIPLGYTRTREEEGKAAAMQFTTLTETEFAASTSDDAIGATFLRNDAGLLAFTRTLNMTGANWKEGAVLRFAIVVADAATGDIYDWQHVSNFTSTTNPNYCPWYLPDAEANINSVAYRYNGGVAPYFWVYDIPQGAVWLNEFRPFRTAAGGSVIELGMKDADPLTHSLDGWEVVLMKSPLPYLNTSNIFEGGAYRDIVANGIAFDNDARLQWEPAAGNDRDGATIQLKGWIPATRLQPLTDEGTFDDVPAEWGGLTFYPLTSDTSVLPLQGVSENPIVWTSYSETASDTFNVLTYADDVFAEQARTDFYEPGVIYALCLRRSNGVVEDKVLFFSEKHEELEDSNQNQWMRMQVARLQEIANYTSAGAPRVIAESSILPPEGQGTIQFLDSTRTQPDANLAQRSDDPNDFVWWFADQYLSTLASPNMYTDGIEAQPYSSYVPTVTTKTYNLGAQVVGSNAVMTGALGSNAVSAASGTLLSQKASAGTAYSLDVSGWDPAWYHLASVTRNGEDASVTPVVQSTYAAKASAPTMSINLSGTLDEDANYVITFLYTPEAKALVDDGLISGTADSAFLTWLMQVAPEAVRQATATSQDGVTLEEKYWIQLADATVDASDVALRVTSAAFNPQVDTSAYSAFTFTFMNKDTPITSLREGACLVLVGKTALSEPWTFIQLMDPEDMAANKVYFIQTKYKFFKAVLISTSDPLLQ